MELDPVSNKRPWSSADSGDTASNKHQKIQQITPKYFKEISSIIKKNSTGSSSITLEFHGMNKEGVEKIIELMNPSSLFLKILQNGSEEECLSAFKQNVADNIPFVLEAIYKTISAAENSSKLDFYYKIL